MKREGSVSRPKLWLGAASGWLLLTALLVGLTASPASAVVFSSNTNITIPDSGNASSYPNTISVAGLVGVIADVNVVLDNVSHTWPDDVDVLLTGPGGADVILMSDVGGDSADAITNLDIGFSDGASALPESTPISSGTYGPTQGSVTDGSNCCGFAGSAPTGPPFGSSLSVFNGTAPNGTWSLYVFDDTGAGGTGSISSGWDLEIIMAAPTITGFAPTSGPVGTSVVITGTNFTGATGVNFAGTPATFTVNSSTQITATVPAGASSGTIGVTTPNGTAVSAGSFTVIPPPTITSFSPSSGKVGDSVTIMGTTFLGATAVGSDGAAAVTSVTFNGIAAVFVVNSSTQITATVPAGASTGLIRVTATGGIGTSATNFVVKHAREVSLHFSVARGNVTVLDGFNACRSNAQVKLQHRINGRWRTVASGVTNATGAYNLGNQTDPGKYRTLAKKFTTPSGDVCLKKKSPVATL